MQLAGGTVSLEAQRLIDTGEAQRVTITTLRIWIGSKLNPNGSCRMKKTDKQLGMHAEISRRDFLNGVSVAVGASLRPDTAAAKAAEDVGAQDVPGYYPPELTGMRGSHPGSFEAAHMARDGKKFAGDDTGERYDLVVVGGGISGLSAAHFYRKSYGDNARILILDNHDDFGGHAKRNEFQITAGPCISNRPAITRQERRN